MKYEILLLVVMFSISCTHRSNVSKEWSDISHATNAKTDLTMCILMDNMVDAVMNMKKTNASKEETLKLIKGTNMDEFSTKVANLITYDIYDDVPGNKVKEAVSSSLHCS